MISRFLVMFLVMNFPKICPVAFQWPEKDQNKQKQNNCLGRPLICKCAVLWALQACTGVFCFSMCVYIYIYIYIHFLCFMCVLLLFLARFFYTIKKTMVCKVLNPDKTYRERPCKLARE